MFVASNFRCAESVSKVPTNSDNLVEAVALKVGFFYISYHKYENLF